MITRLATALLVTLATASLPAQGGRTTNDFRWLVGRWEGHLGSDAKAR